MLKSLTIVVPVFMVEKYIVLSVLNHLLLMIRP